MNAPKLAFLVIVLVTLTGCGTTVTATQEPTSTSNRANAPVSTPERTVATVPDELTAQEALRINPPPPQIVRVKVVERAAEVTWDDPPAVTVPHSYSDNVVSYRVFRRGPGETDLRPVGVTSAHRYVDTTARAGLAYEYAVNSVRENHVEGPRSDAVKVTMP